MSYLEAYDYCISAAGIRYGSVAYIAFGNSVKISHKKHEQTMEYPVEIEFGSDEWQITQNEYTLLNSDFSDINIAREIISRVIVGNKVRNIAFCKITSAIKFDCDTIFTSRISHDPASGFLYSFHVIGGPSWETIDGVSIRN